MNVTESGMVASEVVLPSIGGNVTREAVLEYARAVSLRYRRAGKADKGAILEEFCKTTGYHRKSAIRLLGHPPQGRAQRLGRPRRYGPDVVEALRQVWEVSDRLCSKRLAPFVAELVRVLEAQGELSLSAQLRAELVAMSAATMDRLLKRYRTGATRRPFTTMRSPTTLKGKIPIRTFGEWADVKPGSLQIDLVAHCGESTQGFYLNTLVAVDVATSWCESEVIWGKGQQRVGTGVHWVRQRLPFALAEIHTDNGGEFINDLLYPWCMREGIRFTRGRAYKKNDQAYVEQRNWSVPRRLIGYDRYSCKAAYELMQRLYLDVRLYVNFFQPVRRLIAKERLGAKVKKVYDEAKTPYQRLLATNTLQEPKRQELQELYAKLNPAQLRRNIDETLEALWKQAQRRGVSTTADQPPASLRACG
jgi:transposase InsO family protein